MCCFLFSLLPVRLVRVLAALNMNVSYLSDINQGTERICILMSGDPTETK